MDDPATLVKSATPAVGTAIPMVIGEEMQGEERVCLNAAD